MTSPVECISGPRMTSTPGKRANGNTASLTAMCLPLRLLDGERLQRLAGHQAGGDLGDRQAGRLGDERHGAAGARIDLEHVDLAVLDRELHVHQADDLQRLGQRLGLALDLGDDLGRQRIGRQRAGGVAGMDAGLLDMLHDAGDEDVLVRRRARRHRPRSRRAGRSRSAPGWRPRPSPRRACSARSAVAVVDDLHGAAAQHVGRADDHRIADLLGDRRSPASCEVAVPLSGWRSSSLWSSCWKRSRSSARSIASGEVPRIGMPAASSGLASFSGVWPPNCTIRPSSSPLRRSTSTSSITSSAVSGSK